MHDVYEHICHKDLFLAVCKFSLVKFNELFTFGICKTNMISIVSKVRLNVIIFNSRCGCLISSYRENRLKVLVVGLSAVFVFHFIFHGCYISSLILFLACMGVTSHC